MIDLIDTKAMIDLKAIRERFLEKAEKITKYVLEEMYDDTTEENKEELSKFLKFVISQFDLYDTMLEQCFVEEEDDEDDEDDKDEQSLRELEDQEYYLSIAGGLLDK